MTGLQRGSPAGGLGLVELLETELRARRWRAADLERAIGARPGQASRWLSRQSRPEPRFCEAIAEVLGVDAVDVLRMAGWLEPSPAQALLEQDELERLRIEQQRIRTLAGILRETPRERWPMTDAVVVSLLETLPLMIERLEV